MFVYHIHVYERLIDLRLYETVLNVICEDIGSVDYRVFVYHVHCI